MRRTVALWIVVVMIVLGATGCSSIIRAATSAIVDIDSAFSETDDRDESGQEGPGGIRIANPLIALPQTMLFNVAYMQVFLFAGYNPAFDDFAEGQGVTWKIVFADDDGSSEMFTERALLKQVAEGSWWYLSYQAEDDQLEYEVLLSDDGEPMELVWRDPDSGDLYKHIFDPGDQAPMTEAPSAEDERFDERYYQGTRRVTVGAGTYTADYIVYDYSDPESSDSLEYHWWVAEEVPGDLVKYEYVQADGDQSEITGELMSVDDGYRTTFGVY